MEKFDRIGIVGLGLIGGSIGIEVKKRNISRYVYGFSRKISTMKKARSKGIIDRYFLSFEKMISSVDFLIISTPIKVIENYFLKVKKVNSSLLITDVASVKETIVKKAEEILGKNSKFIGSHPIAGSEKSGIDAVEEGLFEDKPVVITPTKNSDKNCIKKVEFFWKSLGANVYFLKPDVHDKILGFTSHLPHFLVFSLIETFISQKNKKEMVKYFGTGFFDTTRIGKSNPDMWRDIFFSNKEFLLYWISEFEKILKKMKNLLEKDRMSEFMKKLKKIKEVRENIENV